jgi:protein-S-isoprenylcysteine O-methyltransferase Ste14
VFQPARDQSLNFTGRFIELCWVIFAVYWIVAAFAVKRTLEQQSRGQRALLLAVFLAVFLLLRRGGAPARYGNIVLWSRAFLSGALADGVVLAGLIVALWARATLGGNWSATVTFKENHELIQRGPYRYVRHPIYSGALLMLLGTAIFYGRVFGFLALAIVFVGFWFKSRQEERLMTRHFPEAYPSYKARVRALIPFVF